MSFRTASELIGLLQAGRRMLADGAVGSELIKSGIAPEHTVDANLSYPQKVREMHQSAIAAGAEILTSNTFGLSEQEEWRCAFRAGVELAVSAAYAADGEVSVLLSVFPAELLFLPEIVLEPFRNVSTQGCLLLIETAIAMKDAIDAVVMARRQGIEQVAVTCHFQPDGRMPDGTSAADAAKALHQAGAAVLGSNCGAVPEEMVTVAEQMRAVTDLPLLFQPNAGLPELREGRMVYPVDPYRFAAVASALFEAGASVVGGCCGTTPAHIAAVRLALFHPQRRE